MENKTAVEWLIDEMSKGPVMPAQNWNYIKDLFQQALELEKQQRIDNYNEGYHDGKNNYWNKILTNEN